MILLGHAMPGAAVRLPSACVLGSQKCYMRGPRQPRRPPSSGALSPAVHVSDPLHP